MIAINFMLWVQIGLIAFFGSLAFTGFMRQAGLGDAPDGRSAHQGVIPTAGGIGIIAGLGMALVAMSIIFPNIGLAQGFAPAISLVFAMGVLGLCDDALTLGPKFKFAVMLLLCAAAVWVIGPPETFPGFGKSINMPPWFAFGGAVLWIFVVTNAVNFMDGANGMIGFSLTVANFALIGVGLIAGNPTVVLLAGLMLAALLGFLPYNFRRKAQVFCGDVGALTLGFIFAITILFLVQGQPDKSLIFVGPILILPFLTDVLLTIARRAKARENILKAHNTHIYQRLIQQGRGHLTVTWFYGLAALVCANVVVIGSSRHWFASPEIFLMLVGGFTMIFCFASNQLKLTNTRDDKSR